MEHASRLPPGSPGPCGSWSRACPPTWIRRNPSRIPFSTRPWPTCPGSIPIWPICRRPRTGKSWPRTACRGCLGTQTKRGPMDFDVIALSNAIVQELVNLPALMERSGLAVPADGTPAARGSALDPDRRRQLPAYLPARPRRFPRGRNLHRRADRRHPGDHADLRGRQAGRGFQGRPAGEAAGGARIRPARPGQAHAQEQQGDPGSAQGERLPARHLQVRRAGPGTRGHQPRLPGLLLLLRRKLRYQALPREPGRRGGPQRPQAQAGHGSGRHRSVQLQFQLLPGSLSAPGGSCQELQRHRPQEPALRHDRPGSGHPRLPARGGEGQPDLRHGRHFPADRAATCRRAWTSPICGRPWARCSSGPCAS